MRQQVEDVLYALNGPDIQVISDASHRWAILK